MSIRAGGGAIDVATYSGTVIPCPGPPTTSNTDTIIVKDESGGGTPLLTIVRPHRFAPGFTDEGDGTSEIEFQVDLGAGTDVLNIEAGEFGTGTGVRFGLGTAGINLNGDSDADLTVVRAELVAAGGTDADDIISAGGAFATGQRRAGGEQVASLRAHPVARLTPPSGPSTPPRTATVATTRA